MMATCKISAHLHNLWGNYPQFNFEKGVFTITVILRKINEIKTFCFDTFVHE